MAPVPNLVSGQEVAGPIVAPPLEWLVTLILKHLFLNRPCSYIATTCDIVRHTKTEWQWNKTGIRSKVGTERGLCTDQLLCTKCEWDVSQSDGSCSVMAHAVS